MHPLPDASNLAATGFATEFALPLLDPEKPAPGFVKGPGSKAAIKRYAVYRNNVTVSLIEALADSFPAVHRIVGDQFFRDLARVYVRAKPPTSPLLFEYGQAFADFIDNFKHTKQLPWLGDVARLERAWLNSYHAADAAPLEPAALGAIEPEKLGGVTFIPHPAARVLSSDWPAVTIFSANRQEGPVGKISARDGEDALITRPDISVFVRKLPPGGAVFINALLDGASLGAAATAAIGNAPVFDLGANIAGMLEAGCFSGINV